MIDQENKEYSSVINVVTRRRDWEWREEIAKHFPEIQALSVNGPEGVIKGLVRIINQRIEANKTCSADEIKSCASTGSDVV